MLCANCYRLMLDSAMDVIIIFGYVYMDAQCRQILIGM